MSFPTRSIPSHVRAGSTSTSSTAQSPALLARIEEKKAELEHLKELRDLSAAVAMQMENLADKLSTLSDGTEAIATVVGNWHNVLRAINMASSKLASPPTDAPAPEDSESTVALPQTLVRIPTEHAPTLQAQAEAVENAAAASDNPA
ncbi:DASH complex subunit Dad2-domain-containing protein [Stachybotrys elegans]|uniref:DASH complex subunit DAD2 n=1 Tax=Stachybotrys elegans TaxID=80388 RepID=A0A8K0SSN6_9HYPO|nr:DASH complex subunit Dad2-domain-containing protein [Stachybotrys elegans]